MNLDATISTDLPSTEPFQLSEAHQKKEKKEKKQEKNSKETLFLEKLNTLMSLAPSDETEMKPFLEKLQTLMVSAPSKNLSYQKSGPKPQTNEMKAFLVLKNLGNLMASSHDISHALNFSGSWGPVRAVVILEKLVREGRAKKMKSDGGTRYAIV